MLTNVLDVPCLTSYHTIYTTRSSRAALHTGRDCFLRRFCFFFFFFRSQNLLVVFWRIPSWPLGTGVKKQGIVLSLSTLHLRNGGEVETISKLTALPRRDWLLLAEEEVEEEVDSTDTSRRGEAPSHSLVVEVEEDNS